MSAEASSSVDDIALPESRSRMKRFDSSSGAKSSSGGRSRRLRRPNVSRKRCVVPYCMARLRSRSRPTSRTRPFSLSEPITPSELTPRTAFTPSRVTGW